MLSEHEDKPCYHVAYKWTFLEKQVLVWILRDIKRSPSHKYRNPGDHFECNRSSQYLEGPLKNLRPYFDFATCTVPFLMLLFRICINGMGHNPLHNSSGLQKEKEKKSQMIHVCMCYKWSDFIRYGQFLYPTLQVGVSIDLENLLWLSFLTVSHFLWCSPFSSRRFSTTLLFLCPEAINRKQNIAKYLLPYQSPVSWVTPMRTRAG